jgi:iron complex outermembrane receptor protein
MTVNHKPYLTGALLSILLFNHFSEALEVDDYIYLDPFRVSSTLLPEALPQHVLSVYSIDFTQLATSGAIDLHSGFIKIPMVNGLGNYQGAHAAFDIGGEATTALRGLEPASTRVLLNGHRFTNTSGVGMNPSYVNLNLIPVALLSSVDFVPVGGSALYGSDAVAGMINLVAPMEYSGSQANLEYWFGDDFHGMRSDLRSGSSLAGGKLSLFIEYFNDSALYARDRSLVATADYTHLGFSDKRDSYNTEPPTVYDYNFNTLTTPKAYDFNANATEVSPRERYSVAGKWMGKLNPAGAELYVQVLGVHQNTEKIMSAAAMNYYDVTDQNLYVPAGYPTNPYGVDVLSLKRFSELGNRETETDTDVLWALTGMRGMLGEWHWDGSLTAGWEQTHQYYRNAVNVPALQGLLAVTDTSVDVLDLTGSANNNLIPARASALESIRANFVNQGTTRMMDTTLRFYGNMFELPAGPLGVAGGFEHYWESAEIEADLMNQPDQSLGFPYMNSYRANRSDSAVFVEADVPLISAINWSPTIRCDYYSDFGTETTTAQRLEWTPSAGFGIFVGYQEAFRAPSLAELNRAAYASIENIYNPFWGYTDQNRVIINGNPNLDPERSAIWQAGVHFSPASIHGFSTTLQYWRIHQQQVIGRLDSSYLVNQYFDAGDPIVISSPKQYIGIASVDWDIAAGNRVRQVNNPWQNLGERVVSGVDFIVDYAHSFGEFHTTVGLKWTYLLKYRQQLYPDSQTLDSSGDYNPVLGEAILRNKAELTLSCDYHNWTLGTQLHFLQGIHEPDILNLGQIRRSEDTVTQDISVSYRSSAWIIQLGIINVWNEAPPVYHYEIEALNVYNHSLYDIRGRIYSFALTRDF